jgi:hypothetical protein
MWDLNGLSSPPTFLARAPFFNFPKVELLKLAKLNLAQESYRLIVATNIERLLP